jgi:predicted ArsR family transcriptional regulator
MQPTRQKIVELLRERGQATVKELADAVGLTQMAVRHHLNVLYGENLVTTSSVRRKGQPGRPQLVYALTEAANTLFPEDYYRLTDYLLDELKATLGPADLEELLRRIASRITAKGPPIRSGQPPEERLDQLVQFLGEKGYAAQWEKEASHYVIRILTCPYRQVAREHDEICGLDMQMIKDSLDTDPVQTSCMAHGDQYCTYEIPPTDLVVGS